MSRASIESRAAHATVVATDPASLPPTRGHRSQAHRAKGRVTLTRDDIVAAGTELLDEVGVDGLSMRRLAGRLRTGPSTLYWHVRDKDQLLALILDRTIAGIDAPPEGSWRTRLTSLLEQTHHAIAARPALVPVILGARWDVGEHALRIADRSLQLLAAAGVTEDEIGRAYFLLLHYTLGTIEAQAHARWNGSFAEETGDRTVSTIDGSDLAGFAQLRLHGPATAPDDTADRFRYGIDVILDGITGRIAPRTKPTARRDRNRPPRP